ncbi:DUF4145 domain-containing protein [Halomonas sp. BL6]|uniref:DUF4145 domain-containing protein n=1 Tax=Halomonas sp. BL6 TaxID=2585770 RepID=UPI0011183338|nr:DUF4145 domain-containing protein [Halomonas sp. BL6]TNH19990.1 DUF4145 domain-containing protein [Halomonas sp. BL6]
MKYFPPEYQKKAFTCPLCDVYADMHWGELYHNNYGSSPIVRADCSQCREHSYWLGSFHGDNEGKMIYPIISSVPYPNPDMPGNAKKDYLEARDVYPHSPRAAAALLRLALQRICIDLGKSANINTAIGQLVSDGLLPQVQKALDAIRIIGNESVHPGAIKDEDLGESVGAMFELLNFIVQDRITRFKEIDALYESLPAEKRQGVAQRDSQNK